MADGTKPQRIDSITRTVTTSVIALVLIGVIVYLSISGKSGDRLSGLQAVVVGWAGVVVGFYFGGHVAQNTAALEEARQISATTSAEASAVRAEAAAPPISTKE